MIDLEKANQEALSRLLAAQPLIVGMGIAKETVPGMKDKMLLHAGPPLTWETASGPIRGGVMAACMYEGWAKTPEEAEKIIKNANSYIKKFTDKKIEIIICLMVINKYFQCTDQSRRA